MITTRLLIITVLLWPGVAMAKDLRTPPPLSDVDVSQRKFFREIYDNWNNFEIVTSSPDASRRGDYGDFVIYNNSGTYKLCIQTTEEGGTTWVCTAALTSP